MGFSGPLFKLIYHDDMVYEDWTNFRLTLVHMNILIIMQGCIRDSE